MTIFLTVIGIILLMVAVIILPFYLEKHRRNKSWSGVVVDKKITDYYYKGRHRNVYILYIQKNNGEKVTLSVGESLYNSTKIGEKVDKNKGDYFPTSIP